MSDARGGMILEHLRTIRGEIADVTTALVEVKEQLGFLEAQYANISQRVDRIDGRLDRIERLLELVEV